MEAITQGIERANKTLRNVRSAWIKEQQVRVSEDAITEYQVNMTTFVNRRLAPLQPSLPTRAAPIDDGRSPATAMAGLPLSGKK